MKASRTLELLCLLLAACGMGRALGQHTGSKPGAVVATVGDDPIRAGEVRRILAKATGGKAVNPAAQAFLQAQALEEIVDRRLVLAYAQRTGSAATAAEIDAALAELKARLDSQHRSIDDFLKARQITEDDLRRQLAWNVVWEKYLARYVTEKRMEAYFQSHRRELDGTELEVSHILLRPSAGDGARAIEPLVKQADEIRSAIVAGKISFAEAAAKYSAGPSRKDGGRLGLIGRHGPMDEAFSQAAFALDVDQVSRPVRTPFGVHLIRCDAIRPGAKSLADVRKEVADALARKLLQELSQVERRFSEVKYTGAMPYFRPGTREVVEHAE